MRCRSVALRSLSRDQDGEWIGRKIKARERNLICAEILLVFFFGEVFRSQKRSEIDDFLSRNVIKAAKTRDALFTIIKEPFTDPKIKCL